MRPNLSSTSGFVTLQIEHSLMGFHDSRRVVQARCRIDLAPELLTSDLVKCLDLIRRHVGERPIRTAENMDVKRERVGTQYGIAAPSSCGLVELHVHAPGTKDPVPLQSRHDTHSIAIRRGGLATDLHSLDPDTDHWKLGLWRRKDSRRDHLFDRSEERRVGEAWRS